MTPRGSVGQPPESRCATPSLQREFRRRAFSPRARPTEVGDGDDDARTAGGQQGFAAHPDARCGGPILVRGDGTALRSYLYPADLVVWLLRILLRGQRAHAYNVGSDEVVTTAQLARRIAAAIQPTPEVIIQSVQPQGPQNIYLPNIQCACAELKLDVVVPLDEAIARALAFLRSSDI